MPPSGHAAEGEHDTDRVIGERRAAYCRQPFIKILFARLSLLCIADVAC